MPRSNSSEMLLNLILGISVALAVTLLVLIFKVKGGILGVIIGFIIVVALIYWMKEVKRIFNIPIAPIEEHDWLYDIVEDGENIIFVAKVPGPPEEVKVRIIDSLLEIKGGGNFLKRVEISKDAKIVEKSYVNGVLRLKLRISQIKQSKLQ